MHMLASYKDLTFVMQYVNHTFAHNYNPPGMEAIRVRHFYMLETRMRSRPFYPSIAHGIQISEFRHHSPDNQQTFCRWGRFRDTAALTSTNNTFERLTTLTHGPHLKQVKLRKLNFIFINVQTAHSFIEAFNNLFSFAKRWVSVASKPCDQCASESSQSHDGFLGKNQNSKPKLIRQQMIKMMITLWLTVEALPM